MSMNKKVLIISSSPRKGGNSDALCDEFARGAKDASKEVEKIRLAEKRIKYCTGCYACNGKGACVQKDDMAGILEKMVAADKAKSSMDRSIEGLRGFASCLDGAKEKGIVFGTGAWEVGDIAGSRAMKQAYELGKSA